MLTLPSAILTHFLPFLVIFSRRTTYLKAGLMLVGALMCRGGRTVCSILRVLGLKGETSFSKYHNVLNRASWDALKGSKVLLEQIDQNQEEPLRIVIDSHLERRKGAKIKAKSHYHDAVQSSRNYTVVSSGLKWLSVMAITRFSWFQREVALPFLTVLLTPDNGGNKKKHKTMQNSTCQILMKIRRWLPQREIILTADSEFATAEIAETGIKQNIAFVSRLKLNARLFDFPFKLKGPGRPRTTGLRIPIAKMLEARNFEWPLVEVSWYGGICKSVLCMTGTCLWYVKGYKPITIRYVLIKDPENKFNPVLLMSTNIDLNSIQIIETYVKRWSIEVTFHEAREHLGIETQRQWSDLAILRSTPILFGLYSIGMLVGNNLVKNNLIKIETTAWYQKKGIKFSDVMASIREYILKEMYFRKDGVWGRTDQNSDETSLERLVDLFVRTA